MHQWRQKSQLVSIYRVCIRIMEHLNVPDEFLLHHVLFLCTLKCVLRLLKQWQRALIFGLGCQG
jgi:hypothetical protein